MANKATFGCGDFLPGFGPGGFGDYDPPQDEVEEPVDPGWDVDPVDGTPGINPRPGPGGGGGGGGGPTGPSRPGPQTGVPPGPQPPGGGGGGGGPSTPGPPGPAAPGGGATFSCKCVFESFDNTGTTVPGGPAGYITKKFVHKRKCKSVNNAVGTGNQKALDDWKADVAASGGIPVPSTNGPIDRNCQTASGCNGDCPDFVFYYRFYEGPVTPGPPSPGVPGSRPGGDDGGPITPGPAGPQAPGPSPGPTTPGGGGGGGPTTQGPAGPQAPGTSTEIGGDGGGGGGIFNPGLQQPGTFVETDTDTGGGGGGGFIPGLQQPGTFVETDTDTGGGTGGGGGIFNPGLQQPGTFIGTDTDTGGGGFTTQGPLGPQAPGTSTGVDSNTGGGSIGVDGINAGNYLPDWLLGGYSQKDTVGETGGGLLPEVSKAIKQELLDTSPQGQEALTLNLDDPAVVEYFSKNLPYGLLDPDIALTSQVRAPIYVSRSSLRSDIFADKVHESVYVVGVGQRRLTPWDDRTVFGLTTENIISSLNNEFLSICFSIRRPDGNYLSRTEVAAMVRNRLLDKTIDEIDVGYLRDLSVRTRKDKTPVINPSRNLSINEVAAATILETRGIPLDFNELIGSSRETVKNWKVLATDVAKYIPIVVGGETKKYYIKDTDEFIERETLTIEDGDTFSVYLSGLTYDLKVLSEKDHAYIHRQEDRQKALKLLGSDGYSRLSASSPVSANVEFEYSTSTPRENFYVLSASLDNIKTEHVLKNERKSQLIKTTTIKFDLVDISTDDQLGKFNEYIRYKVNGRTLLIDDDDRILDHLAYTSSVSYTQDDILFDVAKSNKGVPLFVRQIPVYLVIVPTNRFDYNLTKSKSKITRYDVSGAIVRELAYRPATDPTLLKNNSIFVDNSLAGVDGTDVYGNYVARARNSSIKRDKTGLNEGYKRGSEFISAQEYKPNRRKSGLRVVREIIQEINNNYLLDDEGLELGVNTFDVFSRMDFDEYLRFISQDNPRLIVPKLKEGAIENVRLYNPINRAGTNAAKKTRLVQRKRNATEDTFVPIKYLRTGKTVEPPGTEFNSSEITTNPSRTPTR